MAKKKKKKNRSAAPRPAAPEAAPPAALFSAKGTFLWLALAGVIFLVLCVLESFKVDFLREV